MRKLSNEIDLQIVCFQYESLVNKKFSKKQISKFEPIVRSLDDANKIFERENPLLNPEKDGDAINISTYIYNYSKTPLFSKTKPTYFPWGELGFPIMLEKLKEVLDKSSRMHYNIFCSFQLLILNHLHQYLH